MVPQRESVLDDILYYIDNNYQTNIKLETIAPLFGYNSAYLGKIFTKATGQTFNSYIDHMRIEHSKELLLHRNMKVYEIAEQVGYHNVDYFHKKFKNMSVSALPSIVNKAKKADQEIYSSCPLLLFLTAPGSFFYLLENSLGKCCNREHHKKQIQRSARISVTPY